MTDTLSGQSLMQHVRALADVIGARPAGKRGEMQARQYVRHALKDAGIDLPVEELSFKAPDTYAYGAIFPIILSLGGSLLGRLGALTSFYGAYSVYQLVTGRRSLLSAFAPSGESANLLVKIPAKGEAKRKVVLIGHLDSNKQRLMVSPAFKHLFRPFNTSGIALMLANGLARLFGFKALQRLTNWALALLLPLIIADELGDFVDGANDNATAVACLLGLGAHLHQNPLENTEVWLAFTGAEEVLCVGIHALLDKYRVELANAWFIDFEMVGAGQIAYVTEHSSGTYLGNYQPDPESLELAIETARRNPKLDVIGAPMRMVEEVGSLRARGFRGICLVGVGDDGWLVNWHQKTDVASNIDSACLEKAARFGLAMLHTLDERP